MIRNLIILHLVLLSDACHASRWPIGPFDLGAKLESVKAYLNLPAEDAGCQIMSVSAGSAAAKLLFLDTDAELVFVQSKKGWILANISYVVREKEVLESAVTRIWGKAKRDSKGQSKWQFSDRQISFVESSGWIFSYQYNQISCPNIGTISREGAQRVN
jgi:hypothetical protein